VARQHIIRRESKNILKFINVILLHINDRHVSATFMVILRVTRARIQIHSFNKLSYYMPKASSKAHSAI